METALESKLTEFSYGFAVTSEIVNLENARTAAPVFPSLYDEGKKGGGYDVKISAAIPIFLQFKLSQRMTGVRASQYSHFGKPYYRFPITPPNISQQHQLLVNLEISGQSVFYIAPEFHTIDEFNGFFKNQAVVKNSAAFSPLEIGSLSDEVKHFMCFERLVPHGYFCSEPKQIAKNSLKSGMQEMLKIREVKQRKIDEPALREILDSMLNAIDKTQHYRKTGKHWSDDRFRGSGDRYARKTATLIQELRERPLRDSLDFIAKAFFGAQLLFITTDDN